MMLKKEKIITSGILILYAAALLGGYLAGLMDWTVIKANYLVAPVIAAVAMGLGKKWFGYAILGSAVAGLLIFYVAAFAGTTVPGAIVNMAALAVGVIAGIILDIKKKDE